MSRAPNSLRRLHVQAHAVVVGDVLYWHEAFVAVRGVGRLPRSDRIVLVLGNGGPVVTAILDRDALLEVRRPPTPEKTSTPHKTVT